MLTRSLFAKIVEMHFDFGWTENMIAHHFAGLVKPWEVGAVIEAEKNRQRPQLSLFDLGADGRDRGVA